jgi:hypothetical protein
LRRISDWTSSPAAEHHEIPARLLLVGPEAGEVLVGPAAEHQRPALGHSLSHRAAHDRIAVRRRPAAVLEAAAEVLVGAARCLHHAIEREVRVRNDFAHLKFLPDVEQSDA